MDKQFLEQQERLKRFAQEYELKTKGVEFDCMICGAKTNLAAADQLAYFIDESGTKTMMSAIKWKDNNPVPRFLSCSEPCRKKLVSGGLVSYAQLMGDIVPPRYWNITLDSFNVDNDMLKKRYTRLLKWLDNPTKGLILYGDAGVGKTCMAIALAHEFRKLERSVLFEKAIDFKLQLVSVARSYKPELFESAVRYYTSRDLVILDDFDIFTCTGDVFDLAYAIFSTLWEQNKLLLLTSNSGSDKLEKLLEPRIWSRINNMCEALSVQGNDLREPKNAI